MLYHNRDMEIHQRAQMLKRFSVMELSWKLQEEISNTFEKISNDTETLENHAAKINEILDTTKTEEEILQKVLTL